MQKTFAILGILFLSVGVSIAWYVWEVEGEPHTLGNDLYFYSVCAGIICLSLAIRGKFIELDLSFEFLAIYYFFKLVLFFINDYILKVETNRIHILTGGFIICLCYSYLRHKLTGRPGE